MIKMNFEELTKKLGGNVTTVKDGIIFPCAYCEGKVDIFDSALHEDEYFIKCLDCSAQSPIFTEESKRNDCIKAWNRFYAQKFIEYDHDLKLVSLLQKIHDVLNDGGKIDDFPILSQEQNNGLIIGLFFILNYLSKANENAGKLLDQGVFPFLFAEGIITDATFIRNPIKGDNGTIVIQVKDAKGRAFENSDVETHQFLNASKKSWVKLYIEHKGDVDGIPF